MKDKRLADGAPVSILERGEDIESEDERQAEQDCDSCKQRTDEEHHGGGPCDKNALLLVNTSLIGYQSDQPN